MRYVGAISDADILINLARVNRLDILELLFKEIIIPQYVYDIEIKKNAGRYYCLINKAIHKDGSIFRIIDREKDISINIIARDIIEDKKKVIGPGESECAGYAQALRIPIIIADNHTEFRWLDEFITLTHNNILALCVYFGEITKNEAEDTFENQYEKSIRRFKKNGWEEYLGL